MTGMRKEANNLNVLEGSLYQFVSCFLIICNNNTSVVYDDTRANYVCFKIIYIILMCNVLSRFQFQNLWQP
jgi:hypothetical protein